MEGTDKCGTRVIGKSTRVFWDETPACESYPCGLYSCSWCPEKGVEWYNTWEDEDLEDWGTDCSGTWSEGPVPNPATCTMDTTTGVLCITTYNRTCPAGEGWEDKKGATPILVDIGGAGYPDTRSGGWKKNRVYEQKSPLNYARFNMDLSGEKNWEWLGRHNNSALLVWMGPVAGSELPKKYPYKIDGTRLFGNVTWGQTWDDGYFPLRTLDKDKNRRLAGAELKDIGIWRDLNSDAVVQAGELSPAASLLTWISVDPRRQKGDAFCPEGAQLIDGKTVATWDWWSLPQRYPWRKRGDTIDTYYSDPVVPIINEGRRSMSIYKWQLRPEGRGSAPDWLVGGYLVFLRDGEDFYVVATSEKNPSIGYVAPVRIDPATGDSPTQWIWALSDGVLSQAVEIGANLRGMTQTDLGTYYWEAELAPEAPNSALYRALTRADLSEIGSFPDIIRFEQVDSALPIDPKLADPPLL